MCAGFGISRSRVFGLTSFCTSEKEASSQLALDHSRTTGLCLQVPWQYLFPFVRDGRVKEILSCRFDPVRPGIDLSWRPVFVSLSRLDQLRDDHGRNWEGTCA
jgi:hypothetical protein